MTDHTHPLPLTVNFCGHCCLIWHLMQHAGEEESVPPKRLCDDQTNPSAGVSCDFAAGLRGLNNLGNTCFMNSVLQVTSAKSTWRSMTVTVKVRQTVRARVRVRVSMTCAVAVNCGCAFC